MLLNCLRWQCCRGQHLHLAKHRIKLQLRSKAARLMMFAFLLFGESWPTSKFKYSKNCEKRKKKIDVTDLWRLQIKIDAIQWYYNIYFDQRVKIEWVKFEWPNLVRLKVNTRFSLQFILVFSMRMKPQPMNRSFSKSDNWRFGWNNSVCFDLVQRETNVNQFLSWNFLKMKFFCSSKSKENNQLKSDDRFRSKDCDRSTIEHSIWPFFGYSPQNSIKIYFRSQILLTHLLQINRIIYDFVLNSTILQSRSNLNCFTLNTKHKTYFALTYWTLKIVNEARSRFQNTSTSFKCCLKYVLLLVFYWHSIRIDSNETKYKLSHTLKYTRRACGQTDRAADRPIGVGQLFGSLQIVLSTKLRCLTNNDMLKLKTKKKNIPFFCIRTKEKHSNKTKTSVQLEIAKSVVFFFFKN